MRGQGRLTPPPRVVCDVGPLSALIKLEPVNQVGDVLGVELISSLLLDHGPRPPRTTAARGILMRR
jgi:hypothetical protein